VNILVCGGAGYIGSHMVYMLLQNGFNVIVIDNLQTGHVQAIDKRAKFYFADIRDKKTLDKIFKENRVDLVMHFAANALVIESMKDPLLYFDNNTYGMQILLKSMIENHVDKIIFSSTCATYGIPEKLPISELTPTNPINPYGESKLMMEKIMRWVDQIHNIKFVSLRYFNAAGASLDASIGEDHKIETHLIPLVLQVPLNKRKFVNICGNDYPTKDGTCIRDYIHVLDLVDAHLRAAEYLLNGKSSNIFNLGNGNGFSVKEIINTARKVTGFDIEARVIERREGDPPELVATNEKARSILNWNPKYGIEDIISTAWNWHKSHPLGYV